MTVIRIREFTRDDIPQVAELHRDVMRSAPQMTPALRDQYNAWLTGVFLDNPMRASGTESLVYDDGGEIFGFLGVVARQVSLGSQTYRAAVGSNFCIRATRRGTAGMQMAREYLARSGDLAFIDELTDQTRRLWDKLGMRPMPQSVRWTIPLAPARHVLSLVEPHVPRPLLAAARPIATALDHIASRVPRSPFRTKAPELTADDLTPAELSRLLGDFGEPDFLRPVTTDGSVAWLVQRLQSMKRYGQLQLVALRKPTGRIVGWYIYYARSGAPCEVMQLVSTPADAHDVLDHLAMHARARGVVSLTGTLDPMFLTPLSDHWAVIMAAPMPTRWFMLHSKRNEILEAFWRNRILLSRMDGEWFQQFP